MRHPVVRLSFSGGNYGERGHLQGNVMDQLAAIERREKASAEFATVPGRFAHLLETLHERHGQRAVVLVDEYDKPILDALDEPETAKANRDYLRGLYGTIKDCDADIRFTLLTGVSKFSKLSLFSTLNNLTDITLDKRYSAICGYTDADVDAVFAAELDGLDRERIREWYNGYRWRGEESVYNPYDVLHLFRTREFGNYWFENGTPAFLPQMLAERGVTARELEGMRATETLLSAFDVGTVGTEALLFQTGYLTIQSEEERLGLRRYHLGYPNLEVRRSLNGLLLDELTQNPSLRVSQGDRLYDLLMANDFAGVERLFKGIFASIPYELDLGRKLAGYEAHYTSVVYSHVQALGLDATLEDSSSSGRADMTVRFNANVYLFEFKVVDAEPEGAALAQLKDKGYADKHRHLGLPIHLIGVEFSRAARNVAAFEVESLAPAQ